MDLNNEWSNSDHHRAIISEVRFNIVRRFLIPISQLGSYEENMDRYNLKKYKKKLEEYGFR